MPLRFACPCLVLLLMTLASLFCHPTSPMLPGKEGDLPHAPPLHFPRAVGMLLMAYLGCTLTSSARQQGVAPLKAFTAPSGPSCCLAAGPPHSINSTKDTITHSTVHNLKLKGKGPHGRNFALFSALCQPVRYLPIT